MLDNDLMKAGEKELLNIKVLKTFSGGEKVYENK
jgi:predicted amidohydrolase YtcJ